MARLSRFWSVLAAVAVAVAAPVAPALAAVPDESRYVKYYEVTRPETLGAAASRFLRDPERADDILHLNADREQPGGGRVTDVAQPLPAGWKLVLPWDAAGDEVRYGVFADLLPVAEAPAGGSSPAAPSSPSASPSPSGPKPAEPGCTTVASTGGGSEWAYQTLAVDESWERGTGEGVLVGVIDSGVDASLPALAGRVATGADVTSGGGGGDRDCLGSGTGMASIIAAGGDEVDGVAPGASILPVRLVTTAETPDPAVAAAGIEVAVSAGATVIALGSYVDTADPAIASAITAALDHDVVVVCPAPESGEAAPQRPGLLRVGGAGPDGQPAASYLAGAVDVTAPGIDVAAYGPAGVGVRAVGGTQYAVAFVAGTAALVRSALPHLAAGEVTHRIGSTANPGAQADRDDAHGFGMINPRAAVMTTLAEETRPVASTDSGAGPYRGVVVGVIVVLLLAAIGMLVWRVRHHVRA
ncbi:S8 family serine peptidase [Catenuloplanes japonicus]|uniref:S8 family serine peptidase n=1 Tax=Catenuloplanes japonicus TaxID=33876 RepID=UPI0012FA846B|nr:S8 family serine peptidase [Catenuloplanes japonicus]